MESHPRPETIKQVPNSRTFQNGNCGVNKGVAFGPRMVDIDRLYGRLLPYSGKKLLSEIPKVYSERDCISIYSNADGIKLIPAHLYKNYQSGEGLCTTEGNSYSPISGRLAGEGGFRGTMSSGYKENSGNCTEIGVQNKYEKVGTQTYEEPKFSRIPFLLRETISATNRRALDKIAKKDPRIFAKRDANGQRMAESDRPSGSNGEAGTRGNDPDQTATISSIKKLETGYRRSDSQDSFFRGSDRNPELVVKEGECIQGSKTEFREREKANIYRCLDERMGGAYGSGRSEWKVESRGTKDAHKLFGNESNHQHCTSFQRQNSESTNISSNRQFHSSELHPEKRRNEIGNLVSFNSRTIQNCGRSEYGCSNPTCGRKVECCCRSTIEEGQGYRNRMVNTTGNTEKVVEDNRTTTDRLVCDLREQEDGLVCISISGSEGTGGRCSHDELDKHVRVRLSSDSYSNTGTEKDIRNRMRDSTDSPIMAQTELVRETPEIISSTTDRTTCNTNNVETTKDRNLPSRPRDVQVSCLDFVVDKLKEKGFSEAAAIRIGNAQRESTRKVYQGKWNAFNDWCHRREIDAFTATLSQVADFLVFLKETKKLAISTIEGYRTAISKILKLSTDVDIGSNSFLSDLMTNLSKNEIQKRPQIPEWNLALVLDKLREKPFEPLDTAELKFVVLKTTFLLALASGRRRGEINALTRRSLMRKEDWSDIIISPDVNFIAKTELAKGNAVTRDLKLQALKQSLGPGMEEDEKLCPVRAIRIYLERTDPIRRDRKKLIISAKEGYNKDICANTISSYLKKTIVFAYQNATKDNLKIRNIKAHQVRSVAASWAYLKNVAMNDILKACSWKSHNTFTSYYLRDLTFVQEEMLKLGPIACAGQII